MKLSSGTPASMGILAGILALTPAMTVSAQSLVITNARIIDGTGSVIERGTLFARGGKIVSVGRRTAAGQRARIDAHGMTVLASYIDAHRHVIRGPAAEWLKDRAAKEMKACRLHHRVFDG